MFSKYLSAAAAIFAATLIHAAELTPSHREAALEFLKAKGTPALLERQCKLMLEKQLAAAPEYKDIRDTLDKFYHDTFGFEALKDDLAKIYASEYSEAELRELTRFYGTELGRKSVTVEEKLIPALSELFERRAAEMVKAQMKK